ncbi:MAG: hypothetical protein J0H76_05160 [Sphingobacteriales bacterium]|nr:hypothetical protein [Sphingobacteriales bacterium]
MITAYKIFWAIATPTKGIATKKDGTKFSKQGWARVNYKTNQKAVSCFLRHASDLKKLKESCKVEGLEKAYDILIITDKQFGLMQQYNYNEVATAKQKSGIFSIGK